MPYSPRSKKRYYKLKGIAVPVDKNIPIPVKPSPGGGKRYYYPWRELEIGDSFLAPGKTVHGLAGDRSYHSKVLGHKYILRAVNGGVRIWRVE